MRTTSLALVLLLLTAAPGLADGAKLSRDAERLYDSALRVARSSRLRDRQVERLREKMEDVTEDELMEILLRLRAAKEPPRSLPEVIGILEAAWVRRSWGEEAAKIPDLAKRIDTKDEEDAKLLLATSLWLEDLKLARHLHLARADSESAAVRRRVALGLGDLLNYGEGDDEVRAALTALLEDADPGVRAVAARRAFDVRFDTIVPWALAHLRDTRTAKGREEELCPGREALAGLRELSGIQEDLTWEEFSRMTGPEKATTEQLFRAWWKQREGKLPERGHREAEFRSRPSETKSEVLETGESALKFRFWSGADRTQIRLRVDGIEPFAETALDWRVHFHVTYMAHGMRVDDGEAYERHHRMGDVWWLARKKIGRYELIFQPLIGDRVRVHMRFYDPR